MKRFLSMSMVMSLLLLTSCSSGGAESSSSSSSSSNSSSSSESTQADTSSDNKNEVVIDGDTYDFGDLKIGIVQLAEHPALDDATEGFVDAITAAGMSLDNIDIQNAQGEQANCNTIALKFVNDQVDLILAVATPAAQAASNSTSTIPVLATAVTDFPVAGLTADNVTGVSDMGPVERQVELVLEVAPEAETVGVLYCSSEDNSLLQAEMALAVLDGLGVDSMEFTVADSNEVQQVTQSMVGKVDAVYIPTDNLLAQTMATVVLVTNPAGIPVIVGEDGMVASGGLATIGVNYYGLGVATAQQAIDILIHGVDISTIEVEFSDESSWTPAVNEDTLAALGIDLPDSLIS